MKRVIRIGDVTSHGGKVISATSRMTVDGKAVDLHGHKTSCGATLITSNETAGVEPLVVGGAGE